MENTQDSKQRTQIILVILTLGIVIFLDQWLKFYIKTNYTLGQSEMMIGNWFELNFTENPGMAFGLTLGGVWGKIVLTVFRLVASGVLLSSLQ